MAGTNKEIATRKLIEFAASQAPHVPVAQQIEIYSALAETLPTAAGREIAKDICTALSRAAALQLDFSRTLFS